MDDMPVGVVVMAYGTPASLDDVEAYYTHIRRGNAPSAEQLAELIARYEAIGGVSPMAECTARQRSAIGEALDELHPGKFLVMSGNKHSPPFIEDAVAALDIMGVSTVVGLVLAPHFSQASVGEYHDRAAERAHVHLMRYFAIDDWSAEPTFIEFHAAALREAMAAMPERHKVLFSAHSLPERLLTDDPYPDRLFESASEVAAAVGLQPWPDWALCWQSAGRTADVWRGPDITEVIRDLAATGRADGVLVCPQGFTSDNLEVLYDLDVVAAQVATSVGLRFARTKSINDDAAVMRMLADVVVSAASEATPR